MNTRKFTEEDWSDIADLIEQGAVQADMSRDGTHTKNACDYTQERLSKLAVQCQGIANRKPAAK